MLVKSILIREILFLMLQRCYGIDVLSKFYQSDYKVRNVVTQVQYVNKDLMHEFKLATYKYNRTTTALNFTIWPKIDLKDKVEIIVQAYKRASNAYRLFPMRFQVNYCRVFQTNALGFKSLVNYGNYSSCNWKKDTFYYAYGFVPDPSHLPPLIPTGEYKLDAEFTYLQQTLTTVDAYVEVYRPEI